MENDSVKFKINFKKRVYKFVLNLVRFVDSIHRDMKNDIIGKQLLRSGTSILANYVEAGSASSKRDFINFFTYSLKSANESKVWLVLMRDLNQGNQKELNKLLNELIEISNVIATSLLTLRGKR